MPELPPDSVEVERIVRAALVTLFTGIEGLPHVLDSAVYVEGESAYVKLFGYVHDSDKKTVFRLLEIVFTDFRDGDAGCADNPVYDLNYSLTLIVSHSPKRPAPDGLSSTDDFARLVLTMRDRALKANHLGDYERIACGNLEPRGSHFGPDETLNLRSAHVGVFSLSVEVTP
ncbi:MAG: hypothetical protein ABW208_10175 [Pyrinomonadaceae bacterium]